MTVAVSLSLEILPLAPDFVGMANPFYAPSPSPPHQLTLWYLPTPSLMSWFNGVLQAAAAQKRLSPSDRADLARMQAVFADLRKEFPFGAAKPLPPDDALDPPPDEFLRIADFLDGTTETFVREEFVAEDPGAAWLTSPHVLFDGAKDERRIVAWRPRFKKQS